MVYYKINRPKEYLFEGQGDTRLYSVSSTRKVLWRARIGSKIEKRVAPHTLRHCLLALLKLREVRSATHHLEGGSDLVFLKEQLGHANIKTTTNYIHLCRTCQRHVNHPIEELTLKIL